MTSDYIDSIYSSFSEKETNELLTIWKNNDKAQYSDDAFIAINKILIERNIEVPAQQSHDHEKTLKRSTRVRRKTFAMAYIGFFFLSGIVASTIQTGELDWLRYSLAILITVGVLNLGVERLHDLNKSGWYILILFIPLLNLALLVFLFFSRGTLGENKFGADPTL